MALGPAPLLPSKPSPEFEPEKKGVKLEEAVLPPEANEEEAAAAAATVLGLGFGAVNTEFSSTLSSWSQFYESVLDVFLRI
jgi:hypothetical protein